MAPPDSKPKTYLLAHGSWHGAWCWKHVAPLLAARGHAVHALSYTGMGERAHLLAPDITIETFVADIVGMLEAYEMENVILVGHSFGGIPVTGAAARMPRRLAHLVYLDAALVQSGQCAFDTYPPADAQARTEAARAAGGLAVPAPTALSPSWGLAPGMPDYDWFMRRLTPHPLGAFTTPLVYAGPPGNGVPATYVTCSAPLNPLLAGARALAAQQSGWHHIDLRAPHEAMVTHPAQVAEILLSV